MADLFPLIDRYHSLQLGADLAHVAPDSPHVVESDRRLRCALSYGYVHALWWVWLEDGRSVVSVPPGAGPVAAEIAASVTSRDQLHTPELARRLTMPISRAMQEAGLKPVDRSFTDLVFACNDSLLRRYERPECRRLVDESAPVAEGIWYPSHCLPDGIAFGAFADGKAVSVAYAHRTGVMEDRVACLGVETAPGYRRRGYAQACVSGVVAEITARGGEARYGCSPSNEASQATARSVGFVPYGQSLILAAPAPNV
jgi:ribosomal protein S18 acetylase RimI-like enzyme